MFGLRNPGSTDFSIAPAWECEQRASLVPAELNWHRGSSGRVGRTGRGEGRTGGGRQAGGLAGGRAR